VSSWPDEYAPLYGCSTCCLDFTSLDAFDRHRVGPHEHGRRCLDLDKLDATGLRPMSDHELAASMYASRARSGVALVQDPASAERARRMFSERA
jgi:hypothetical protein